ncbi:MAG: ASCH domain-containing protein [Candidatus Kapaibacterium sp.]
MILGFKKQFIEPIKNGTKIHTIREDKPGRWKAGNIIHFATGIRTKEYNQFHEGKCKSTQKIVISYSHPRPCIYIDDKVFWDFEAEKVALNDGFDSLEDFFKWFNKDFTGKIIHWTDYKY